MRRNEIDYGRIEFYKYFNRRELKKKLGREDSEIGIELERMKNSDVKEIEKR